MKITSLLSAFSICILYVLQIGTATQETKSDWNSTNLLNEIDYPLLFTSKRGSSEIFKLENGEEIQLTSDQADNRTPRLSPDGTKILFDSETNGRNYDLYLMDINGNNKSKLTSSPGSELGASWGNDSNTIFFESDMDGDFEIYMMKLDSKIISQITHNNTDDFRPVLSPDGKTLVFTSERDGNEELYSFNLEFFLNGNQKLSSVRLTKEKGRDSWASFSKNGKRILFHSERTGQSEIFEMDIDGKNVSQITDFPKNGDAFFPWYLETKSGTAIMYSSEKNDHYDWDIWVYYYNDNDSKPFKLIDSPYRDYRVFSLNK